MHFIPWWIRFLSSPCNNKRNFCSYIHQRIVWLYHFLVINPATAECEPKPLSSLICSDNYGWEDIEPHSKNTTDYTFSQSEWIPEENFRLESAKRLHIDTNDDEFCEEFVTRMENICDPNIKVFGCFEQYEKKWYAFVLPTKIFPSFPKYWVVFIY